MNDQVQHAAVPAVTDRAAWQAQLDELLVREKAHTREGDAIAAARRRLPMVEVDASVPVTGEHGPVPLLDVFEGRKPADRLLPHVARRQARGRAVRGLHVLQRAGPRAVLPARAGRHLRDVLPGPVRREHRVPRLHGLGHAVVLRRRLRGRAARRALVRHAGVLPARRRPGIRDVLEQRPGRRGVGAQLRAAGHHRLRPAGDSGRTRPRAGPCGSARTAINSAPTGGRPRSGPAWPRAGRTT